MKQISLSESERVHIIAALLVTSLTAVKKDYNGTLMRLARKIQSSLYPRR